MRGFGFGVGRVAALLSLRMRRRVIDSPGRPDSPFLGTLVASLWFDRGPLERGRCSFAEGHWRNSIASGGDDLVLSGRRITCFRSRMGGFADNSGMGFGERDPSI